MSLNIWNIEGLYFITDWEMIVLFFFMEFEKSKIMILNGEIFKFENLWPLQRRQPSGLKQVHL